MIELIKKTREYLDYVEQHYNNVQKAWQILQDKCKDMRFIYDDFVFGCIDANIKRHDESKLSVEEFVQYRQFFYPVLGEKKNRTLFTSAWANHLNKNLHHWQSWTSQDFKDPYSAEIYLVENICDWMAMGFEKGDNAKEYYESNKDSINMPDWAVKFMYEVFERIY